MSEENTETQSELELATTCLIHAIDREARNQGWRVRWIEHEWISGVAMLLINVPTITTTPEQEVTFYIGLLSAQMVASAMETAYDPGWKKNKIVLNKALLGVKESEAPLALNRFGGWTPSAESAPEAPFRSASSAAETGSLDEGADKDPVTGIEYGEDT
jgi:hypothetical protein